MRKRMNPPRKKALSPTEKLKKIPPYVVQRAAYTEDRRSIIVQIIFPKETRVSKVLKRLIELASE